MALKMTTKESRKMEHRLKRRKKCQPHVTIMPTMTKNQLHRLKQTSLKQRNL